LENVVYKLPDDYFEEGRIGWGNLPDLSAFDSVKNVSKDGTDVTDASAEEDIEETTNALSGIKFLNNSWVQVLTDAGEPYYWNTENDMTSWQQPK
jgi:hypothetical protein